MVHHARSSILPKWYAEAKFLQSESMRMVSDATDNFIFGRIFRTPTNQEHRDGNHLRMSFCHLEFPWDCSGVLADPPCDIARIVRDIGVNRCTVDCTLVNGRVADSVLSGFEKTGFVCERDLEDYVMCLDTTTVTLTESQRVRRATEEDITGVASCNARSFGYTDMSWLVEKLLRQLRQPDSFRVYALYIRERVAAFAVIYTPWEKSKDLAFVQVMGTDPEFRRQGLAYEVLAHAVALLPKGVRVYLEAVDPAAIALYEKLGFAVVGKAMSAECWLPSL
ncbi:hypothetical protein GGI03_006494 [Coemansia sp. RSA 2337]|nr:hypothetical protein H4S04_007061 [Coemansia sp. S16]KAJ2066015.1 hypothetical protein GGI08_002071 [Coemansia sp. S2]KAJ2069088.1 hypothetical protein GGH13_004654 [Coemansia sp. S155-1]KAJ2352338.1 hypothetical protein GGH92_001310 [Coemansia sp. RSA 2673]KAJ2455177.1 hypothetical protein GGI03_006494 [Coemansia sp. RSA 2337]